MTNADTAAYRAMNNALEKDYPDYCEGRCWDCPDEYDCNEEE